MYSPMHGGSSEASTFDLGTPTGVEAVLQALRASSVSAAVRHEVRDLVFNYASSGGDAGLRTLIEDRLKSLNITADLVPHVKKPEPVTSGFSHGRLQPKFTPPKLVPAPAPAPAAAVPSVPAPAPAPVRDIAPAAPTAPAPETSPARQVPLTRARIEPVVPKPVPAPVREGSADPLRKVDMSVPRTVTPQREIPNAQPAPQVQTPVVPAPSAPTVERVEPVRTPLEDASLERIRAIKADINTRVGNPVNLVDIDNEIGRQYMNSLLSAMKLIGTGNDLKLAEAMTNLEAVYGEVGKLLAPKTAPAVPEIVSAPMVPNEPLPTPVPPPAPVAVPEIPVPVVETVPVAATPAPAPAIPATPDPEVPDEAPVPIFVRTAPTVVEAVEAAEPDAPEPMFRTVSVVTERQPERSQIPVVTPEPAENAAVPSGAEPTPEAGTVPIGSTRFQVSPVAARKPLRAITDLPTAADVKANGERGVDDLHTKEVDDGLSLLLSEWSLFRKSGLFGTGPKGLEHPLFKKLAPMPIPVILSGKFEGSSDEIRQSIMDYMNGWRYEQGIIYEKDETFDHYLRRVIRHIIDWQTKAKTA